MLKRRKGRSGRWGVWAAAALSAAVLLGACEGSADEADPEILRTEQMEEESSGASQTEQAAGNGEKESRSLTQEELERLSEYFSGFGQYGFLQSFYTRPEYIDLGQVYYNGAGIVNERMSGEEYEIYARRHGAWGLDITRLTGEEINDHLRRHTGLGLDEMADPLTGWFYIPEYDVYVWEHGDTNYAQFECLSGRLEAGDTCVAAYRRAGDEEKRGDVTLKKSMDGDWHFVSNVRAVEEGAPLACQLSEDGRELLSWSREWYEDRCVIPEGISRIAPGAFSETKFRVIIIPSFVEEIGEDAFSDCRELSMVVLQDGITEIRSGVFQNCANLWKAAIPDSVKRIGRDAFSGCALLESIEVAEDCVLEDGWCGSGEITVTRRDRPAQEPGEESCGTIESEGP